MDLGILFYNRWKLIPRNNRSEAPELKSEEAVEP